MSSRSGSADGASPSAPASVCDCVPGSPPKNPKTGQAAQAVQPTPCLTRPAHRSQAALAETGDRRATGDFPDASPPPPGEVSDGRDAPVPGLKGQPDDHHRPPHQAVPEHHRRRRPELRSRARPGHLNTLAPQLAKWLISGTAETLTNPPAPGHTPATAAAVPAPYTVALLIAGWQVVLRRDVT